VVSGSPRRTPPVPAAAAATAVSCRRPSGVLHQRHGGTQTDSARIAEGALAAAPGDLVFALHDCCAHASVGRRHPGSMETRTMLGSRATASRSERAPRVGGHHKTSGLVVTRCCAKAAGSTAFMASTTRCGDSRRAPARSCCRPPLLCKQVQRKVDHRSKSIGLRLRKGPRIPTKP